MYGPPPDPREIPLDTSFAAAPLAWIACVALGLLVALRFRGVVGIVVGSVIALTTPALWFLPTAVWGAFPTVDKAGSLLFFRDGVHLRVLDAADPAVRLIGVHLGHLWATAALAVVLPDFAAFNLQAMLHLVFAWLAAIALFRELGASRPAALACAFPFAMGLHTFRDIEWYTIEKSSQGWLALYAWALVRASRGGSAWLAAGVYAAGFFYNAYWGVLGALVGGLALVAAPRAVLASAFAALPLVFMQARMIGGVASPEAFLTERAALDTFDGAHWNRLELWRAVNMPLCLLAFNRRNAWLLAIAALFALFAAGPATPLWSLFTALPGLWRFARPETLFHVAYLALLAGAARTLSRWSWPLAPVLGVLYAGWIAGVRTHPVFPGFTAPIPVSLDPRWAERLPGSRP